MKRLQKGFTLIELLIVIGIILILAGIVLVNVSTARDRAREAAIISALSQIRSDKELNFTNSYQKTTGQIVATIKENNGSNDIVDNVSTDAYAVASILPTKDYYCVDSKGASKKTTSAPNGTVCP